MITIEDIFKHADIDDLTDEEDGIELVFTFRDDREVARIWGSSLDDALEQAGPIIGRHRVLCDLRREGLSDEDIDRLVVADDFASAAYDRGFIDGASETAHFLAVEAMRTPDGAYSFAPEPALAAPAMAAAAEPITPVTSLDAVKDNLISVSGSEIPITLALLMPGRIIID